MSKIEWTIDTYEYVKNHKISCVPNLVDGYNQGSGIKRISKYKLLLKRVAYPLLKIRNDILVDGFIERTIGQLIINLNSSCKCSFDWGV